jgi:colanic acid/amylovoran biosynthesis glycosyltransferase
MASESVRVLYLVNAYPRVSHTFIRREILALERAGWSVVRVSARPPDGTLVDAADLQEAQRTLALLERGALGLMPATLRALVRSPTRFFAGFATALRLARGSEAGFARHLAYFAEACLLAEIARRERVEHVHAHFGTNPPVVALIAERLGAPGFSFTVHGPEEFDRVRSLKLAKKVAAARFTIAISSYGRAQLQRFAAVEHHARIHVVHCGLDADYFDVAATPPTADGALLFVGRLCPQKQPLALVEAAAVLAAQGMRFKVRIVGGGELLDVLTERIRAHGLESCVALLGPLDGAGVRRELQACRAFVLPSSAEGLPVVLMEALALRRPVVSTFVAGIPELVRDGREGWLVPAGDVAALADAMRAALEAPPELLARLGASGAQRVRERHDVDESARRLGEHFRQAAQPRAS